MRNITKVAGIIIFIMGAFVSVQADVLPATAKLVPAETVLLIDIDNFNQCRAQFEKTPHYKFYNDPAMAAFIGDFKTRWHQKVGQLNNEIARAIIDADVLPEGRVAFALVFNKKAVDANEPWALFVTQWGQNLDKIKEAVEKAVQKAVEDGLHQKSEDYQGVNIKTIIAKDSSRLGCGFSSSLSYCFIDDCLIGSEDIELLRFAIAHIKGAGSPALADDADYTSALKAVGPYYDVDFYVNIKQIIKMFTAEDVTGQIQTIITNLGLDNAVAVGCSLGLAREPGGSCGGKAFLKVNGAKKGILKILEAESAALRTPRFIPASAYSVSFLNLSIKKAYDELYKILYNFNPMSAAMMHTPLLPPSPDGQPGLQLKTDVIDHLGSQIIIAQSVNKPFSKDLTPTESLIALAVSDGKALEKSLSLLHNMFIAAGSPDAKRELLGHTIYLIKTEGMPFFKPGMTPMQQDPIGTTAPQMPTLAFTITDTHLLFATESAVERAIRTLNSTESASLVSAGWFSEAKSAVPSVAGLAGFQDSAASSEFFWWLMKENSDAFWASVVVPPGSVSPEFGPRQIKELVDFSLLPQFDTVRKYFGLSTCYGVSRPDGFFFEFKNLNPTGTD